MKNIKKILLPFATLSTSLMVVTPLISSCGSGSTLAANTEIAKNYTPTITKHAKSTNLDPDTAASDYLAAIKKDKNIFNEDYKYTAGKLYDFADKFVDLFKSKKGGTDPESVTTELKVNTLKAGTADLSFDDNGKFTYRNGMTLSATMKLDLSELMGEDARFEINANKLGFETKFVNFDSIETTHATSLLEGDYTVVRPVFPSDLTDKNWAVELKVFGGVTAKLNDNEIASLSNLNINWTFNYSNLLFLFISIASSETYLMDVLQTLGSFSSYYLSDVTCANRIANVPADGVIEVVKSDEDGQWYPNNDNRNIVYTNPKKIDVDTLCTIAPKTSSSMPYSLGDLTKDESEKDNPKITQDFYIYNDAQIEGGYIDYSIAKYREDEIGEKRQSYQWKEKHTIYPKYVQTMKSNDGSEWWVGNESGQIEQQYFYTYGTLCKFNLSITEGTPIKEKQVFLIKISNKDGETDPRTLSFKDVVVKLGDTALTLNTDYKIQDNKIVFLKDIAPTEEEPEKNLSIEFTSTDTVVIDEDEEVYEYAEVFVTTPENK